MSRARLALREEVSEDWGRAWWSGSFGTSAWGCGSGSGRYICQCVCALVYLRACRCVRVCAQRMERQAPGSSTAAPRAPRLSGEVGESARAEAEYGTARGETTCALHHPRPRPRFLDPRP
eukprot:3941876-Rhodomonas_salina.1